MATSQQDVETAEPTKGSTQDGEKQKNGAPGKPGGGNMLGCKAGYAWPSRLLGPML
jgi:hypothetical protein